MPKEYLKHLLRFQLTGLEIDRPQGVQLTAEGEIEVDVLWYGYDFSTWEPLSNVLQGAQLLLYAYIKDHEDELDPIVVKEVVRAIKNKTDDLDKLEQKARKFRKQHKTKRKGMKEMDNIFEVQDLII